MSESALISIKPVYADAIFSGAKTVELRRRIPSLAIGTRLWIYATLPRGMLMGSAIVSHIFRGTPDEIWASCHREAGVDRGTFDSYFEGAKKAHGIELTDVVKGDPVAFSRLKEIRENFHPPQVLMRLSEDEADRLDYEAKVSFPT